MRVKNLKELDAQLDLSIIKEDSTVEPIKRVSFGQYTSFLQPIDWAVVAEGLVDAGYNAGSWHVTSAWDADPTMWPWEYDPITKKFDLSRPNQLYWNHVKSFLSEMARNKIRVEISLHDGYYQNKWVKYGAAKQHPYRDNKQNINWGDNDLALPENKPWWTHVAWRTEGGGFNEHVVDYRIIPKYNWLWRYHRLWGKAIKAAKAEYPRMPMVLVRYINENHARFDAEGNHTGGFGGEDKLFQIVQMEWEKLGLQHRRDFCMVNDWMPFQGTTFLAQEWAKAGMFDRHPNHRWMREVHGCDQERIDIIKNLEAKYPALAHTKFTILSTDGFRPEDGNYTKALNSMKKKGYPHWEGKVPSEPEVANGKKIYYPGDYEKTFKAVLPVMKDITK